MWDACHQTFHLFSIAPDSTQLVIHHSLLCSGIALTGPGVLYHLRFRAKAVSADAWLRLKRDASNETLVIDDGVQVLPLVTTDALLTVNGGTDVPPTRPSGPVLRAAPNPFNPRTELSFELTAAAPVSLCILRLDGTRVRTLLDGSCGVGIRTVTWDGRDDVGHCLAAGCYLATLAVGDARSVLRISLVR